MPTPRPRRRQTPRTSDSVLVALSSWHAPTEFFPRDAVEAKAGFFFKEATEIMLRLLKK